MDLILYAIPVFFLLIALELALEKIKGTGYYRVNDSITSLTTGVLFQLVGVMQKLIPFALYASVYQLASITKLPDTPWTWLAAFVLYDFFYYWNHRMGHEVNILWAAHVVHHSSEEYNLTTALRQTSSGFVSTIFYLPMAIMGFDPLMVITIGSLSLIYQFWVHTQHVPKLGWFELFFITPSNHRAHHAQNAVYIDRNYGGVFIVWDRLFGSYQEELDSDPPIFGIRGALRSWNPLWANIQVYNQLLQDCLHTDRWWYKLTLWFRRTGWRPPDVIEAYPLIKTDLDHFEKFDLPLESSIKLYCLLQYALTAMISLAFIINVQALMLSEQFIVVGFVVLSGFSIGAIMQHKHYAGLLEIIRILTLVVMVALSPLPSWFSIATVVVCSLSLVCLYAGLRQRANNDSLMLTQ